MPLQCNRAHPACASTVDNTEMAHTEAVAESRAAVIEGESEKTRIERLERQRPDQLGSAWKEIGFVFSIVMSQALTEYFVSGFTVLVPTVAKNILLVSSIQLVAWYVPMGLGGFILAIVEGFFLHMIPPMILMIVCGLAIVIDSLLFALQPHNAGYWAWIFPAMLCATIAIDLLLSVASIFFSTTLPAREQGLAGALSNVLVQLGVALLLGLPDIVVSNTAEQGERQSYENAFWFELACAGFALVIFVVFVRIHPAKSDLTADEREEQKAAVVELSMQQKAIQ